MDTQPYLDKLKAQHDKIAAELAEKKADLEIANQNEVGKIEEKLEEVKENMEKIKNAGEEEVEELKDKANQIISDVETSWNNFLEKLKA